MTDITPDFNLCLRARDAQPVLRREYNPAKINGFIDEAYDLNDRLADLIRDLRSIRPRYLSTAPPSRRRQADGVDRARPLTDRERDEYDALSKKTLRTLDGGITKLKKDLDAKGRIDESIADSKRGKNHLGWAGRWAAGGAIGAKTPEEEREVAARKAVLAVRESIILFLQGRLEEASRVQGEMMDVRLRREVEKSKSILHKSSIGGNIPYAHDEDDNDYPTPANQRVKRNRQSANITNGTFEPAGSDQVEGGGSELSRDQMQLFAEENNALLEHYNNQLDQVRTAEKSILEISELHNTLHANLQQQTEHIDQLVQDSYLTTENLGKGNKELKRASERRSTAQAVFWGTVGFCSFLVVWDLIF